MAREEELRRSIPVDFFPAGPGNLAGDRELEAWNDICQLIQSRALTPFVSHAHATPEGQTLATHATPPVLPLAAALLLENSKSVRTYIGYHWRTTANC
jgi:HEAT repeat protein